MNTDIIIGNWHQVKGAVQEEWGKLTDNDLDLINGRMERLMGVLQAKYGWKRQEVQDAMDEFLSSYEIEEDHLASFSQN